MAATFCRDAKGKIRQIKRIWHTAVCASRPTHDREKMMPSFTPLPVRNGEGPWHVNYFRVFIWPNKRKPFPSGCDLIDLMPSVMNHHTAAVSLDSAHQWQFEPTLLFRGVARIRPFAVMPTGVMPLPVPLPKSIERYGVPESARTWLTPQVHTDTVGVAQVPGHHSFTVQTLKRNYETGDDRTIRKMAGQNLEGGLSKLLKNVRDGIARPLPGLPLIDPFDLGRRTVLGAVDQLRWLEKEGGDALDALCDLAVTINQHHFLAGRRAFRMSTAKGLKLSNAEIRASGLTPGDITDDLWVFETAAVERYSMRVFQYATEYGMGGDAQMLKPVWTEMCDKLALHFGKRLGRIDSRQEDHAGLAQVLNSPTYKAINNRHAVLLPSK